MHVKTTEQFADLMNCESVEAWRKMVFSFGGGLGFERSLLAVLPDPKAPIEPEYAFLHSNYSAEWLHKYTAEKMHHIDPAFAHCLQKSTPLVWSPNIFSRRKQKEMYEEACGFGVRSGITLPIHGANGELGLVCFVTDSKPGKRFQQDASHTLPELSLFRDFIFESSLHFIKKTNSHLEQLVLRNEIPVITPSEMECLKWCAVGKSSWDIAQILNCSEAAVNFHFSNLRRKFKVSTRQQVVVKAIRYKLIFQ